jgi:transposase
MSESPNRRNERVGHVSDTELLHKCKPEPSEPVRRLEVFTGAGRRRQWSSEQKAQIVAESYEGGASVSTIARRHGLTPQQLFGWRRKARRTADDRTDKSSVAFAPVLVEPALRSANIPERVGGAIIEVMIGAATVRIPRGIDGATLTTVLRAVMAAT